MHRRRTRKFNNLLKCSGEGRRPSGPAIECLFCCAVHLCRALGDRKVEKKKKVKKKKKIFKKEEKEMKKENCRDLVCFLCICLFSVNLYY